MLEIINSDQGIQFTSPVWVNKLNELGISISMDGRGRATDNIYIERFWRTLKQDYIYPFPAENGTTLWKGSQMVYESLQQRENQPGDWKTNAGKCVPVKGMIFYLQTKEHVSNETSS